MPYFVHPRDLPIEGVKDLIAAEPEHYPHYDSKTDAHEFSIGKKGMIISFIPSQDENRTWQRREEMRFTEGSYVHVPWGPISRYSEPEMFRRYPHLSVKHPGLIAYTKDEEHGLLDRQTAVRPGRFIEQFDLVKVYLWSKDYK